MTTYEIFGGIVNWAKQFYSYLSDDWLNWMDGLFFLFRHSTGKERIEEFLQFSKAQHAYDEHTRPRINLICESGFRKIN